MSEFDALALDSTDTLAAHRRAFALPLSSAGETAVYLCGHSLGLAPRGARKCVVQELDDWEQLGVLGHEHAHHDWISYTDALQGDLATIVGALPHEVVAMNSLTVNLHLLLASLYRPTSRRHRILIEQGAFSSDRHVVRSQLRWHGHDPDASLIELAPKPGADLLDFSELEAAIGAAGESLALILWPGVQYLTGQLFDMQRLAAIAHDVGALLVLDQAHAAGNVPLAMHDWQVDAAAWSNYKYLNGGPGAIGGFFLHERHARDSALPRLEGWWGHAASTRFQFSPDFVPGPGAAAWQLSNPPILSAAPLHASLAEFRAAGMPALRAKSLRLTGYLRSQLQELCDGELQFITGAADHEHGAQLSVRVRGGAARARKLYDALLPNGLIADWREPDVIRLAPVPLYNSFHDAWRAATTLQACLTSL